MLLHKYNLIQLHNMTFSMKFEPTIYYNLIYFLK